VQRAEDRSQRDYVLDQPTVKRLEHVSKKNEMNRYPLEHWAELALGYLAHVPLQEIRTHDSIFRVSLIKERPVSRNMEVTDS
jgi:hypothetical protein